MLRKIFAMMLSATLLLTAFGLRSMNAQGLADARATEKIRTKVQKIGTGGNARVEVKLRDNTRMKGYISGADQDSFTLVDSMSGSHNKLAYADTSSVNKAGGGLSGKTWIILGAAAVGAIVTWVIIKPVVCDGGAQTRGPC
ncbi:MAG TPA: hypothetical protein VIW64_03570 [Pyrinomonadaceae bacterium]|jgi:hypothetical protein